MAFTFRRKDAEFKPDSQRRDLPHRLYLSPQQQKKYLKWILFSMLSLLMLVLQDVLFSQISIYGATVDMVPCVLLLICVLVPAVAVSANTQDTAELGAATYTPRLTAPSRSNGYYYSSKNILYAAGYGMPNCTAYAYGRAYEILGKKPNLCVNDANNWYN